MLKRFLPCWPTVGILMTAAVVFTGVGNTTNSNSKNAETHWTNTQFQFEHSSRFRFIILPHDFRCQLLLEKLTDRANIVLCRLLANEDTFLSQSTSSVKLQLFAKLAYLCSSSDEHGQISHTTRLRTRKPTTQPTTERFTNLYFTSVNAICVRKSLKKTPKKAKQNVPKNTE